MPNIQELCWSRKAVIAACDCVVLLILTLNSVLTTSKRAAGRFIKYRLNIDRARARARQRTSAVKRPRARYVSGGGGGTAATATRTRFIVNNIVIVVIIPHGVYRCTSKRTCYTARDVVIIIRLLLLSSSFFGKKKKSRDLLRFFL